MVFLPQKSKKIRHVMEVLLRKSKDSLLMSTKNLVLKLTLKSPTNFPRVFLKLILLSLRSSTESIMILIINLTKKLMRGSAKLIPNLIVNSPQKLKILRHVMLATSQKHRKFLRDFLTSKNLVKMILTELHP